MAHGQSGLSAVEGCLGIEVTMEDGLIKSRRPD
jgi:hypothetical protein